MRKEALILILLLSTGCSFKVINVEASFITVTPVATKTHIVMKLEK